MLCSSLRECCWCVRCTTFICLCGEAEEDISSPSDFSASLIFLACFSSLKLLHQPFPMNSLSLFTSYFFEKSLDLSPSVSSPLHLSAMILSISNPFSLLSSSSSSSASSSAPSQIHLCLLSSLHAVAAIFSPYLEPDILSLLMILKRNPGRLLPEHA